MSGQCPLSTPSEPFDHCSVNVRSGLSAAIPLAGNCEKCLILRMIRMLDRALFDERMNEVAEAKPVEKPE